MNDEVSVLREELALLRARAELWETAEQTLGLGVWEHDLATNLGRWSEQARRLYGLDETREHASPEAVVAAAHPDDCEEVSAVYRAMTEGRDAGLVVLRHRVAPPIGEARWVESRICVVRGDAGRPRRLVGVALPYAGAELEDRLPRSRDQKASYPRRELAMNVPIWVRDVPSGALLFANAPWVEVIGREPVIGEHVHQLFATVHPEDRPRVLEATVRAPDCGFEETARFVSPEGKLTVLRLRALPIRNASGVTDRVVGVAENISEQLAAENTLRQSEQTLRDLGEILPALFWVRDARTGALLYANPAWTTLMGSPAVLGEHFLQLSAVVFPDDRETLMSALRRAPEGGFDEVLRFVVADGSVRWIRFRTFPIRDANGVTYRVAGIGEDITEHRLTEQALRDSEARYRSVILAMSDGIVVHGRNGEIVTANPSAERMLGLSLDQLQGRTSLDPRWRAVREDGSTFPGEEHPGWLTLKTGEPFSGVIMGIHTPDGALRWLSVNSRRVTEIGEEGAYSVVASFTDITERRAAEEKICASLREKEILLKEIHHRVKNNLQVVSSLLYLQSTKVKDPRFSELFKESQNRVASMALIHEMLYQQPDLPRIPFTSYVRVLGESLARSHGVEEDRVALFVETEGDRDLVLSVETAVPCGLLLNEILSNSLKHAFPLGRRGTIRVVFASEHDVYRIVVSDDGVGLPADFEERRRASLGTKLIDRLVDQLRGSMVRSSSDHGTRYELTLPRASIEPDGARGATS